jgi:hypothetical protein
MRVTTAKGIAGERGRVEARMNTKVVMAASALFMAVVGVAFSFLPVELLRAAGESGSAVMAVAVQVAGAMLLGFAILNWMAKESVIGGIYNRPLAMGNFMHFAVGAIALVKAGVWIAAAIYAIFAVGFGAILFGTPRRPAD